VLLSLNFSLSQSLDPAAKRPPIPTICVGRGRVAASESTGAVEKSACPSTGRPFVCRRRMSPVLPGREPGAARLFSEAYVMTAAGSTSPNRGSSRAEPHGRRTNGRSTGGSGRSASDIAAVPANGAGPPPASSAGKETTNGIGTNSLLPAADTSRLPPETGSPADTAEPATKTAFAGADGKSSRNGNPGNFAATVGVSNVDV